MRRLPALMLWCSSLALLALDLPPSLAGTQPEKPALEAPAPEAGEEVPKELEPPELQPPEVQPSPLGRRFTILFTGNTNACLEGSAPELGGLARRASAIAAVRAEGLPVLLLDAGGLFAGEEEFDRARSALCLRLVTLMGCRALNVSPAELRFGWPWLAQALQEYVPEHQPPLVSANVVLPERHENAGIHSAGIAEVEPWRVALAGFGFPSEPATAAARDQWLDVVAAASRLIPELERQGDAIIVLAHVPRRLLADLAVVRGVSLIISADDGPDLERIAGVPVVHCRAEGAALGRIDATIGSGGIQVERVGQIPLDAAVPLDPGVEQVLASFRVEAFQKFGGDRAKPPIPEDKLAPTTDRVYVGTELCADCHKDQFAQWKQTRHAHAFDSLHKDQRHFLPKCQTCHTTGFGSESGFDPKLATPEFRHVQCEACHGPGNAHALDPQKGNIRGKPDTELCRHCHDAANSPNFERQLQRYLETVDHKQALLPPPTPPPTSPQRPSPAPAAQASSKPLLELFVMSMCPYAIQAEEALFDWLDPVNDRVDFRLHFIAREQNQGEPSEGETRPGSPPQRPAGLRLEEPSSCAGEPERSEGPFASLHGAAEVDEDIRQAVMIELFPDRYRSYIRCRNRNLRGADWRLCALESGIDPEVADRIASSPEGREIFRRNIARTLELGIELSPTLLVNGQEHGGRMNASDITLSVCHLQPNAGFCAQQAECQTDADCEQPGKVAVCAGAGTPQARCRLSDPVPFSLIAINAPPKDCPVCHSGPGLRSLIELFPYANVRSMAYDDPAARSLVERYGLTAFPAYLFSQRAREDARFDKIKDHVKDLGNRLLLEPGLNAATFFPGRKAKSNGIDLWVEPHAEASLRVMSAFIRHTARRGGYCNFHYLVSAAQPAAKPSAAGLWEVLARYRSSGGEAELREAACQLCIQKHYPEAFYRYVIAYNAAVGAPWAEEKALKVVHVPLLRVAECASGQDGLELMNRNYQLQQELHVLYAPMALINNRLLISAESIDLVEQVYDMLNPEEAAKSAAAK